MNQILISAMWEVVMTSDLTHTLTRPLSQSVIMMTANGQIHKFIKNTEQISSCRILIKIRALYFTIIPRNKFHFFSLE